MNYRTEAEVSAGIKKGTLASRVTIVPIKPGCKDALVAIANAEEMQEGKFMGVQEFDLVSRSNAQLGTAAECLIILAAQLRICKSELCERADGGHLSRAERRNARLRFAMGLHACAGC